MATEIRGYSTLHTKASVEILPLLYHKGPTMAGKGKQSFTITVQHLK